MDNIQGRFTQLETSGLDLRTEQTRWGSLLSKMHLEAPRIKRVLDLAGGLEQLRQANPPAQGLWWSLDEVVAASRRRTLRRLTRTGASIFAFLAIIWALLTFVFPPDPNTVLASEAISTLQQLAFEERWEEALTVIEDANANLTVRDVELLIWEAVVREKLGQGERAQELLDEAKALVPQEQHVAFWWTLGSTQLAVGALEQARAAGNEAIALDPTDPQGYFLLGSVAEVEGDTAKAIELFDETFQLAADGNPQLAVIARVRMGNLLQRPANMSLFAEEENGAVEPGSDSQE